MATVIAVANQKGGVGKTTLTRELGACLAARGFRVLLLDCDSQANLTNSFFSPEQKQELFPLTLAHVMVAPPASTDGSPQPRRAQLADAIVETTIESLDIVGASKPLANLESQNAYVQGRLRTQLASVGDRYDIIFLDCTPKVTRIQTEALCSADWVLIPCKPSPLGLEGVNDLLETIYQVREDSNAGLKILGAVINMSKRRFAARESQKIIRSAEEALEYVFTATLGDLADFDEAPGRKMTVIQLAPRSKSSQQINALTDEMLIRLGLDAASSEAASPEPAEAGEHPAAEAGHAGDDSASDNSLASAAGAQPALPPAVVGNADANAGEVNV